MTRDDIIAHLKYMAMPDQSGRRNPGWETCQEAAIELEALERKSVELETWKRVVHLFRGPDGYRALEKTVLDFLKRKV